MLNLAPIFDDASEALDEFGSFLEIPPLPTAIFLMQRDVVNHYRHALTHYLDLTLKESFLQNSSLGTPYEKWAKFANDDFAMLSFAVHNLLRYSSRLIHTTRCRGLISAGRFPEMKTRSNEYTTPLCEIKYAGKNIGVRILPDYSLAVTPFAKVVLHERFFEIRDRNIIGELKVQGLLEVDVLAERNTRFGKLCTAFHANVPALSSFDSLHESWCV